MSWGANNDGELGIGTRFTGWTPAEVTGLDHVVAIDAGSAAAHGVSGAIRDEGTVWLWGSNVSAMFGNGEGPLSADDPGARYLLAVPVKGIAGAKSLSLGEGHVAVLLDDGTLRMWGHDGWGQIGVGTSGFYQEKPNGLIIQEYSSCNRCISSPLWLHRNLQERCIPSPHRR